METKTVTCPECEKMKSVSGESQKIGEFLDWLSEKKPVYYPAHYWPVPDSFEKLLAEYFGIDLKKVEAERAQILEEIRKAA